MGIFNWVKTHILTLALVVVILYLIIPRNYSGPIAPLPASVINYGYTQGLSEGGVTSNLGVVPQALSQPAITSNSVDQVNTSNRVTIQESNLSLQVNDVQDSGNKIVAYASSIGGYMVQTSYNHPTEAPFASITVRVPTEKLNQSIDYFKSLSIKITSENLLGQDVTDQYQDIDAKLETLQSTKTKFEDILSKATSVQDIVEVQNQIIDQQNQIDVLTGEKKAIDENSKLTKITLYLSTDEFALPYTPDQSFRPDVIFKNSVRSLISTLRFFASAIIWLGVYSIIWLPIVLGIFFYNRWRKKVKTNTP